MKKKSVVCEACGCRKETFGKKMELLCPWCDEERMIEIAREAVRRNNVKVRMGVKKG